MDIEHAFTYINNDEKWLKKFLIGSLLLLTLIGFIPVIGWMIEIIRQKIEAQDDRLPEWNAIGKYTITGLKFMLLGFIWSSPLLLFQCFLLIFPLWGTAAIESLNEIGRISEFADISGGLFFLAFSIISPILLIYGLFLGFLYLVAYGNLATTGSFKTIVNPLNAFRLLRANFFDYLVAFALMYGFSLVGSLSLFLCIIGFFPVQLYYFCVKADLIAQAYTRGQTRLLRA